MTAYIDDFPGPKFHSERVFDLSDPQTLEELRKYIEWMDSANQPVSGTLRKKIENGTDHGDLTHEELEEIVELTTRFYGDLAAAGSTDF